MVWVLWAHVPAILIFALAIGQPPQSAIFEVLPVVAAGTVAILGGLGRTVRSMAACIGLLTCSAIVVHLSGGYIELHFHFFVMVALMAVYQEWTPFLLAIGYVVVHHGLMGIVAPGQVFNHEAGRENPLFWAAVHGGFILGLSAVLMISWSHAARGALIDPLTALANRTLLTQRLQRALRQRHDRYPVAVLFIDLDDFKHVNDSLGHAAGDELLAAVAERFVNCVRPEDTVSRLGGDEFAILLPSTDQEGALTVARRLLSALDAPFLVGEREVYQHATIGIALGGEGAEHADGVLRDADTAMYDAKAEGKGRATVFRPELHAENVRRLEFEGQLRRAIESDHLRLEYQPILDLSTGAIASYEALVRWTHPTRGNLPPADFIPLAEETGLIMPLGRWVLREACTQFRRWQQLPGWPERVGITVNVSAHELRNSAFPREVAGILEETGLRGDLLTLELTESVLVIDADVVTDRMMELKALGVRIAIDDFGSGYSSLSYLQRLPVDMLKIDRTFIETINRGAAGSAVMQAALAIGRTLEIPTVAEGVELPEQLIRLKLMGCRLAQGFHFSRPLPADAAADFLLNSERDRASADQGWSAGVRKVGTDPVLRPAGSVRRA